MLDGYVSEKEQLEDIKKWWNENGKFILIAIVIGLGIGFGWRYWHRLEITRAENAAMVYQSVMQADEQKNTATVLGGAKILMEKFSGTPYASLAALLWAKEAVTQHDLKTASEKLSWVITQSDQARLKQIARISQARILLSENNTQAAMQVLSTVNDKEFAPLIAWVKGDIYTQEGDAKNATHQYQIAKSGLTEFPPAANLLNQLLAQPV
ncbi:MAG: hypothetical protein A3C44_06335 [Gammaproteobacteria bacterium RIFCSPHIGHO2_02_FULL_39_13]|nr:MAG: hypothetical protein A3C44_06335 [Gammaproteobacteria bacterium RIFCSPHIGHO2_02_FULL_39_13]OGT49233.1 MAG: hypothetical protein A3E53_07200 [Gammaproteobacteria bacterium RIFCSPHIGHO2_12_FULL_39_24]